jgi:PAS domain S-box-containing protein
MTESNPSPDGRTPASTVAQGQDITERKREKDALRVEEEIYRLLFANMAEGFALYELLYDGQGQPADWRVLEVNDAYTRHTGVAREQIVGRRISEVFPAAIPEYLPRFAQVVATQTPLEFDTYAQAVGRYQHVHILPAGGRHFAGIVEDITQRKWVEEAFRESKERFREIIENAPFGYYRVGKDGLWQYVNRTWGRMHGLSLEQVVGKSFEITQPEDAVEQAREYVKRGLAGETITGEFSRLTREGKIEYHSFNIQPVKRGNEIVAIEGFINDITDRRRAEERTRRLARELLVVRENERKQVSATLHHDVGSLAVGISAHLDAIEKDLRCGKIEEALKWMKGTRKLFDESVVRLKRVATQLRPPELDVLGLPAALRQHFSQVTEHGHARIHFRENLGRRRVAGDTATILFRVAQEALTNAITHGDAKRVDVNLRALKKEVRLTVRDNGKGFDLSEHRAREASRIGLHVMQEMTIHAGGAFLIDSKRGKGTTVRVSLPLRCEVAGASGDGRSAGSDNDGG